MMNNLFSLPGIISGITKPCDEALREYALESFAKEVDFSTNQHLLTRLVLDHSRIAKRLEQLNRKLEHNQKMLDEAQHIAMLGRWDVYPLSGERIWSPSLYDILEIDPSLPASSEVFVAHVHPEDHEKVMAMYNTMFLMTEPWTTRYRLRMNDGRIKWVQLRGNGTVDNNGKIDHCFGTIQDITTMKNAEEKLERYNRQLKHMVDEKVKEISNSQMATITALVKLSESRDDSTGTHIERTAGFCRLLAEKARLHPQYASTIDDTFVETIHQASPLHDIGKVGIADSILLKPGKLTDEEFALMKNHVRIGYQTLADVGHRYTQNSFVKMGMEIARYHHEKYDGSGYDEGLFGDAIPLSARIMAIADVYDALRSERVYKTAYSHEKSIAIIKKGRGSHFDPVLADIFMLHNEEFLNLYNAIAE